jgi:hypothetical protein
MRADIRSAVEARYTGTGKAVIHGKEAEVRPAPIYRGRRLGMNR